MVSAFMLIERVCSNGSSIIIGSLINVFGQDPGIKITASTKIVQGKQAIQMTQPNL